MADQNNIQTIFVYEAKNREGKKTKGEIIAPSIAIAKAQLIKKGITPKNIKKKPKPLLGGKGKVTPFDIALLTRQLSTMMRSGVPLVQSFDIVLEGLDNRTLQDLLSSIRNDVASGVSFADSVRKHPQYFDELYCNLVEAGEQAGALEQMLSRIATYLEKTETLKKKVRKAMTYPISVLVVAFIVTILLLVKVVPQFESMFSSFGSELPAFTQLIVAISEWMQSYWFPVILSVVGGVVAFKKAIAKSQNLADGLDRALLKAPVVGEIMDKSAVARFGRVLATTFAAGVPLVDALDSVSGAAGNAVYRDATKKIRDEVSSGGQLQAAMKDAGIFPVMAIQLTKIGEESGNLDEMLAKVADHYEEVVDDLVDGLQL